MAPREASICQVGRKGARGPDFAPTPTLFWKVLSDADEGRAKDLGAVRYPFLEPGSPQATYHFALRAGQGRAEDPDAYRFGMEQSVAPVAAFLPPAVKPLFRPLPPRLPPSQSFLDVSPPNVVLLTLKQPEDGVPNEVVLRFMELAGKPSEVRVSTSLPLASALSCDLVERAPDQQYPVDPLRFPISRHEIVTVRARLNVPG